jgi:hypothetical protein
MGERTHPSEAQGNPLRAVRLRWRRSDRRGDEALTRTAIMVASTVRVILSLVLVGFVYAQTGWATALCIFLMFLRVEIDDCKAGRSFRSMDRTAET